MTIINLKLWRERGKCTEQRMTAQMSMMRESAYSPLLRKNTFAQALRFAWAEAKAAIKTERIAAMTGDLKAEYDELQSALFMLKMKDRWNRDDYSECDRLHAEIKRVEDIAVSVVPARTVKTAVTTTTTELALAA